VRPFNDASEVEVKVVNLPVPGVVAPMFTPSNVVEVAPKATLVEPIVTLEFVSLALAIEPANIVLVTVPVSPVVTIVPATAGTLMLNVDAVLGPTKLT
jgi:hypothetical protein